MQLDAPATLDGISNPGPMAAVSWHMHLSTPKSTCHAVDSTIEISKSRSMSGSSLHLASETWSRTLSLLMDRSKIATQDSPVNRDRYTNPSASCTPCQVEDENSRPLVWSESLVTSTGIPILMAASPRRSTRSSASRDSIKTTVLSTMSVLGSSRGWPSANRFRRTVSQKAHLTDSAA